MWIHISRLTLIFNILKGFALPQGYTQLGAFSSGIEDDYKLRPLLISSGMVSYLRSSGTVKLISPLL